MKKKLSEYDHPQNLDEAIDVLFDFYSEYLGKIKSMSEDEFNASVHMSNGMGIRNLWYLWWHEDHNYPDHWPKEKPAIVDHFNSMDIVHADDMSGIIMTSFYRKLCDKPIDLKEQIKRYHDHWKEAGYEDGIPKK